MSTTLVLQDRSYDIVSLSIPDWNRRSNSRKIGNLAARTVSFFNRQETKTATLIAGWSLETFATVLVILTANSLWISASLLLLHAYSSFCLLTTLAMANTKSNG